MAEWALPFFSGLSGGFSDRRHQLMEEARQEQEKQRALTLHTIQAALQNPNLRGEAIPLLMSKMGETMGIKGKKATEQFQQVIGALTQGISEPEMLPQPNYSGVQFNQQGQPSLMQAPEVAPIPTGRTLQRSLFYSPDEQMEREARGAGLKAQAVEQATRPGKLEQAAMQQKAATDRMVLGKSLALQNSLARLSQAEQYKLNHERNALAMNLAAREGRPSPSEEDNMLAGSLLWDKLNAQVGGLQARADIAHTEASYRQRILESRLQGESARRDYLSALQLHMRDKSEQGEKIPPHLVAARNNFEQAKNRANQLYSQAAAKRSMGYVEEAEALRLQAEGEWNEMLGHMQTLEQFPDWVRISEGGWPSVQLQRPQAGMQVAPVPSSGSSSDKSSIPAANPAPVQSGQTMSRSVYNEKVKKWGKARVDKWIADNKIKVGSFD